ASRWRGAGKAQFLDLKRLAFSVRFGQRPGTSPPAEAQHRGWFRTKDRALGDAPGALLAVRVGENQPTLRPTTDTKLTQRPGAPPRLWVRPIFGSLICRGPASPRNCSHISYIMRNPDAPIGWPNDFRPPSGFTGSLPSRSKKPSSTSCHAVPRGL